MGRVRLGRKGQSVVLFVIALVAVMGFVALVIDYGQSATAKSTAQKAADAAAMAAALDLPNASSAISVGEDYAENNGIRDVDITVITPYDGESTKVKVICKKPVKYTFARVLGFTEGEVVASAVALRRPWAGDALPFVNLDDDYTEEPFEIEAWESVDPGRFESIWPDEYEMINPDDPDTMYFKLDYMDGLEITQGTVATVKQEVGWIFDRGGVAYILSLDDHIIRDTRKVLLTDGTTKNLEDLNNRDIIHPSQLRLLKCIFHDYDYTGKHLYLTFIQEYNFYIGELPGDYETPDGTSMLLIE